MKWMNERKTEKKTLIVFEANYKQRIAAVEKTFTIHKFTLKLFLGKCMFEWMKELFIGFDTCFVCLFEFEPNKNKIEEPRTEKRENCLINSFKDY